MGVHSSFKKSGKSSAVRSVLSRPERIKSLQDKGSWDEKAGKITGLPKLKVMKIKAAKKAAKAPEEKDGAKAAKK